MLGPVARDLWSNVPRDVREIPPALPGSHRATKSFVIYDTTDQKAVVTRAPARISISTTAATAEAGSSRIHKRSEGRGPRDMNLDSYMDDAIQKAYAKYEDALRAPTRSTSRTSFSAWCGSRGPADGTIALSESPRKEALPEEVRLRPGGRGSRTRNQIRIPAHQGARRAERGTCASSATNDQSIYRGAAPTCATSRLPQGLPDARSGSSSRTTVLEAHRVGALAVIAPSPTREPKSSGPHDDGHRSASSPAPTNVTRRPACSSYHQDARDAGISRRGRRVLLACTRSRAPREALRAVDMPYQIVACEVLRAREIKDALSYLRVLCNPRSDVDMLRLHQHAAAWHRQHHDGARLHVREHASASPSTSAPALTISPRTSAARRRSVSGSSARALTGTQKRGKDRAPPSVLRWSSRRGLQDALEAEDTAERRVASRTSPSSRAPCTTMRGGRGAPRAAFVSRASCSASRSRSDSDKMDKEASKRRTS